MDTTADKNAVSEAAGRKLATRFTSLQALRAIAALLVVMYHVESHFANTLWESIYTFLFSRGHIGVDMFFVLSGFLMTYVRPEQGGANVAAKFLFRRLLRIWPSYVIATLLVASLIYYASIEQVVMSILFLPQSSEPPLVLGFPTLFVGWTLNYEAYFYLLCGLLIWSGKAKYFFPKLLVWALLTLILLPLAYGQNLATPPLEVPADKYPFLYLALVTNPIIWEFIMGAAIAVVIDRYRVQLTVWPRRLIKRVVLSACLLFVASYVIFDNKMEPLACGIPAAILVAALVIADLSNTWSVPRWMAKLGDSSYGIYLLHPLWVYFFSPVLEMSPLVEAVGVFLVVAATILSAVIMHRYFERPVLRLGKALLSR